MATTEFNELAGRIDGVAQALMRLTAMLEMAEVINGPLLSEAMRQARPGSQADGTPHHASQRVLSQMAEQLDDARKARPPLRH